uniref:beta-N-acetylhexosaminidase n=1 Tax=Angiostrongylus cantonensis TaxID=6313 RepID=A0A158P872_ANGCA
LLYRSTVLFPEYGGITGAPPRPTYFKRLLTLVKDLGADGVLIEWEDMFPYAGALSSIKNGNAYSVDETLDILQHANSVELSVIPLVQTVGHLEWILKTKEFASLRENASYPMVVCIANDLTLTLILDSIHQVIAMHSNIRAPYIHIGADEAFQVGECDADHKVLPVKYANSTKRLMLDYIRAIATNITQTFKKTKVLMWFDEVKNTDHKLIKEYELDRLVIPVVWKYTTNLDRDLPPAMWEELARSFSTVWGASAFKGADGPNRYWNRMKTYMLNNKQYDHFAALCELMPVSMASLAISIRLIHNYTSTIKSCCTIRYFPFEQLGFVQIAVFGAMCSMYTSGYKVRDSIRDFMLLKQQYDNATWIHRREAAYLQRSQIHLNASNPFYVDVIGNSYRRWLNQLDKIIDRLSSMNDLFYKDVFMEFLTDYITPFYDELKESVEAIDTKKTYGARPWFRR